MSSRRSAAQFVMVLALAGVAYAAGDVRKDLHFKVGKHPMITIENPYGPVVVRAGAAHEVLVTAILHSDKVELEQSQSHNRIELVSHLDRIGDRKGSQTRGAAAEYFDDGGHFRGKTKIGCHRNAVMQVE